jgi:hypothetical protein
MKIIHVAGLCGLLALISGCGQSHQPLVVGKLESGTFWKSPTSSTNNEGGGFEKGSRVEIYEHFIVITTSQGNTHVYPQGNYSELVIKRE